MPILKVNVGTSPTLVQTATEREWLIMQNLSDTDIYLSMDGSSDVSGAAGAKPGVRISANGGMISGGEGEFNIYFNNPIYAVHEGTGNKVLTLQHA